MPSDHCELLCLDLPLAESLRTRRPAATELQRAAGAFQALGDPTRLSIALALRDAEELCVCDLGWIVERAQNLVSHHLRALRAAGLAEHRRDGKMVLYSLTEQGRTLLGLIDAVSLEPVRG